MQFAHSIRTMGCGLPGHATPEYMAVLEGVLRKFCLDSDTFFIHDFVVRAPSRHTPAALAARACGRARCGGSAQAFDRQRWTAPTWPLAA